MQLVNPQTPGRVEVTVTILTYNGEKYLEDILTSLEQQDFGGTVEILVIDSGSTDSTLNIVGRHPQIRLHQIPNSEFGHGKTRQLAAELARGEIVAYLTHDAIPANSHWLYEITTPFRVNPHIAAVMGAQRPRAGCFPLLKYEIQSVFRNFGPDFGTTIFYQDSFIDNDAVRNAVSFYSDVNSAARREVLLSSVPYRDVSYAEDQLLGKDIIAAGLMKAYAPRAVVEHSNDMTIREYDDRMYEETQGLREVGIPVDVPSAKVITHMVLTGCAKDSVRILRDRSMSPLVKAKWLLINPAYHLQKWRGIRRGAICPLNSKTTATPKTSVVA